MRQCNFVTVDNTTSCTSCGREFKSVTDKYTNSIFTDDEIIKVKNKTPDILTGEFIEAHPGLIKRGIDSGILSEDKINKYKKTMKNINQIFKYNKILMEIPEVSELITYCEELEESLVENNHKNRYNKETILLEFLKELSNSCDDLIKTDEENIRFKLGEVDFKASVLGLNKNIKQFFKDNNI